MPSLLTPQGEGPTLQTRHPSDVAPIHVRKKPSGLTAMVSEFYSKDELDKYLAVPLSVIVRLKMIAENVLIGGEHGHSWYIRIVARCSLQT